MAQEHIIWTNVMNYDEWSEYLNEEYPDLTDVEREQIMYEMNDEYLLDEVSNLNIELETNIVVIASLGLWNGRHDGYRILGANINDCLTMQTHDYVTYYLDENFDFRCNDVHHDGTNRYLFRAFRRGLTEAQKMYFLGRVYSGEITQHDIDYYTTNIGNKVAAVYGWKKTKGVAA